MGTDRALPMFDFGHDSVSSEKVKSPPYRDRVTKVKDMSKRLARCGKCDNCCRRDCGTCYNCADKPKFGGAGVKKQACINRKCTVMTSSLEEAYASKETQSAPREDPGSEEELKPVLSDALPLEAGTWYDPLKLQAEFIEINERHRRESKLTAGVAAS